MDMVNRSIEDHILLWLSRTGKTSEELAQLLGMSRQSLWNKRNGNTAFKSDEIYQLCELLEISPNELMGY